MQTAAAIPMPHGPLSRPRHSDRRKIPGKILLDKLNTVFDSDEVSQIFAKRNAFSSVGGEFFCTKVINALGGLIADAINEETAASEKRMSKYLKSKPKVEVVRNDRGTADNS